MKDGEPPGFQASTVECRGWVGGGGGENSLPLYMYLLYLCPW